MDFKEIPIMNIIFYPPFPEYLEDFKVIFMEGIYSER